MVSPHKTIILILTILRSFMPSVLTPTVTESHSIRIASVRVVLYSTSSSTVGNFKLCECLTLRKMKITKWSELAQDCLEWKKIVEKAKTLHEL